MVANLFMEVPKTKELIFAPLKHKIFNIFVHEMFIVWLHGHEKLEIFKKQFDFIKFTMEIEFMGNLCFLNVPFTRNHDGSISY